MTPIYPDHTTPVIHPQTIPSPWASLDTTTLVSNAMEHQASFQQAPMHYQYSNGDDYDAYVANYLRNYDTYQPIYMNNLSNLLEHHYWRHFEPMGFLPLTSYQMTMFPDYYYTSMKPISNYISFEPSVETEVSTKQPPMKIHNMKASNGGGVSSSSSSSQSWINDQNKQVPGQELNEYKKVKRTIHMISEQRRRDKINTGFERLRQELLPCDDRRLNKIDIIRKTTHYIQRLQEYQAYLTIELKHLTAENEKLKATEANIRRQPHQKNVSSLLK
jgi:hypothetical protein